MTDKGIWGQTIGAHTSDENVATHNTRMKDIRTIQVTIDATSLIPSLCLIFLNRLSGKIIKFGVVLDNYDK